MKESYSTIPKTGETKTLNVTSRWETSANVEHEKSENGSKIESETASEASIEVEVKTAIQELKAKLKELNLTDSVKGLETILEADDEALKDLSNDEFLNEIKKINAELDEKIKAKANQREAENKNESTKITNEVDTNDLGKVEAFENSSSEKIANKPAENKEAEEVKEKTEQEKDKESQSKNENESEKVELDHIEEAKLVADEYENLLKKYINDETLSPEVKDLILKGYGEINLVRTYKESDSNTYKNELVKYTKRIRQSHEKLSSLLEPEKANKEKGESLKDPDKREPSFSGDKDSLGVYQEARKEWKETRDNYRKKESEYKEALNKHYSDKSWGAKARKVKEGIGKFFGIDPKLPPEIQKTKDEFQALKKAYASNLDEAMFKRSHVRYGDAYGGEVNKEYRLDSNSSKIAFGKKFILKPHQQFLEIQKAHGMTPEMKNRLGRIGAKFAKYKWPTRYGIILMATLAGAATGGVGLAVAGGSTAFARIAVSAGLGGLAGREVYKNRQNAINEAKKTYESAETDTTTKFSLDSMGDLDVDLERSSAAIDRKNFQQKAWSVTAGGIVGGAAGLGVGAYGPDVISPSIASSVESAKVNISSFGDDAMRSIERAGIEVLEAQEKISSPHNVDLQDVTTPDYGSAVNSSPIKSGGSGYNLENIQETQNQFGKNEAYVTDKTELPYGKNELNDIQGQYGKTNVEMIPESELSYSKEDLDQIQSDRGNHLETDGSEQIYKVQNGDNLWQITKDQFASELKGLSLDAQNRVLDQLFDRVRLDSDLRASLELENFDDPTDNISSEEEIDHLKAGDEIHLDKLGEELKRLVEQEKNPLSQPMNGSVEVSTDTPNEVSVPIETAQEYKVVAEAVNYNTTPGFHIKADSLHENIINEMKAYSQQLATDHIRENPDFTHDTEALRHAVWQDFRKMYPDVDIQEFGFDRPTLDNYAQNLKTHGVEIVTEGARQVPENQVNTARNAYHDPNQYPSRAPNNILYGTQPVVKDWGWNRGSRIPWVDPQTGVSGMHSGYGSTHPNQPGFRPRGGYIPGGQQFGSYGGHRGSYFSNNFGNRGGFGGGMYGRGAIGPLEYNHGHNRFGGSNFYGPNRVFIPPTETELRMLAEREAEMYNQQTAPPVEYISRPDAVAQTNVNTMESPQTNTANNQVEDQLAGNDIGSDTNIENLQRAEHEKIVNDFRRIYQTETPGEAERILDTEMNNFVKSVEKIDDGFFSRLSGGEVSPFQYFGTATVSQFEEYMNQNSATLKPFLEQNDMKYETFLNLKNAVQEASLSVPHDKNTTIENLFANYLLQYAENNTNPSGFYDERMDVASETPVNAVESVNNTTSYPAVELVGDTLKLGELNLRYGGLSQQQTQELYNFAKQQASEIVKEDPSISVTQLSGELQRKISESSLVKNVTSTNISYARRQ